MAPDKQSPQMKYKLKQRMRGLCTRCTKKRGRYRWLCDDCQSKENAYMRRYRRAQKLAREAKDKALKSLLEKINEGKRRALLSGQ